MEGVVTRLLMFVVLVGLATGCVSAPETPTQPPPPTLAVATGIPVTPRASATQPPQSAAPTATVQTLPTPENTKEIFAHAGELLAAYKPPESDPGELYDALATDAGRFLMATANPDVSLEGQPALAQLQDALKAVPNLPENASPRVTAIHIDDDQGGSRDLALIAMQGVMGLPIIAVERLGGSYENLPAVTEHTFATADDRYFYPAQLDTRDVTGDGTKELVYTYEFPGGSGATTDLTIGRWIEDDKTWRTLFQANLIDWAGKSDYQLETSADASNVKLTFPWFGAFDHKLLAHPNATQTWEYDAAQDRFVQVSQTVDAPRTPRQQLNAAEYLFRNGDLQGAARAYHAAWSDASLQPEDFADSKADPAAFARWHEALVLGLLGRDADAKALLADAQKSGAALGALAAQYARNNTGKDGALKGWIAVANAGDLYQLIYEGKAGNLDFPFDAREVYAQGAIVSTYLNTHAGADKNPEAVWQVLAALGFKPAAHANADLDGDGTDEFLLTTREGGNSPNATTVLWFVYRRGDAWRVRSLSQGEVTALAETVPLPQGKGKAIRLQLAPGTTPNMVALGWDGTAVQWLDADTLLPRPGQDSWPTVGGGVVETDF